MNGLRANLMALGPMRLAAMALVAIGMFGALAMVAMRGSATPMVPLYSGLDLKDSAAIVDQLTANKIPASTDQDGTRVLVPNADLDAARLSLAKAGLPSGGTIGWEIFDKSPDLLTESEFQQNINQTRALEGELDRTISLIDGIRSARVNLVLPSQEPFSRDTQEASASVLLTTRGAGVVDRESVRAILNLVAAAVPGLKTQNVAIVDSEGNLLARAGEPLDGVAAAQTADELKSATEARLASAVEEMLGRTLGPDHVRATATVDMDFDTSQQTTEKYDPDQQVARSTQTVTTTSKSTDASQQNVSVQNNLPNANAGSGSGGSGSTEQHSEETDNYEIGKTVSTLVHDQPQISRISLAVMVDGITTQAGSGKPVWAPLPDQEIVSITDLVKSAIGFDAQRGDKVDVICMPFQDESGAEEKPVSFLGMSLQGMDLSRLAEDGLIGVMALAGMMFVVRPMLLRLTAIPEIAAASGEMAAIGADGIPLLAVTGGVAAVAGAGAAGGMLALPAPGAGAPEVDDFVTVANIEGQLRASSIRRLSSMVEKDPSATLSIIRGWLMAEPN